MRRAIFLTFALLPAVLHGYSTGPDPGYAGVPGEYDCSSCHGGGSGSGGVTVTFPGGMTFMPGVTQHLIVTVTDTAQARWGFELTARPAGNPATQAGVFKPGADGFTQLVCSTQNFLFGAYAQTCTDRAQQYPLQYIEHTSAGSRPGQTGSAQFSFDWTPPASATGAIVIYVAANAANNNGTDTGDHIYTSAYTLAPAGAPPMIQANGVVNAAGFQATIAPGSWVAIEGSNLSASTRVWGASDMVNGALPTQLDGVQVSINNKPAFVEYISPTLVNVLAPADSFTGSVVVQIANSNGTSEAVMANLQTVSPAFFLWNSRYAAATRPDYSLVGPPNLFPGSVTAPAKPGDVIVLWATGFGPTSAVTLPTVFLGDLQAKVLSAVLTPGNAGLYQIAIQIPANAPNGDLAIVALIDGLQSPSGVVLTVLQ